MGGGSWGGQVEGGQAGCERRIEVFVKIKKKKLGGGSGWWGQGGCEYNITKMKKCGGGGGGGGAIFEPKTKF